MIQQTDDSAIIPPPHPHIPQPSWLHCAEHVPVDLSPLSLLLLTATNVDVWSIITSIRFILGARLLWACCLKVVVHFLCVCVRACVRACMRVILMMAAKMAAKLLKFVVSMS